MTGDIGWKGKKFLGRGGMGQAGLWEYTMSDEDMDHTQIVVKQSLQPPHISRDRVLGKANFLNTEGTLMRKLAEIDSKHIVKLLYGPSNDPFVGISRIFMEYCREGDLRQFMARYMA
jgi:hypothetical protein